MSFSYSGDPLSSTRDQVRHLIRDTVEPGFLSNEEIAWELSQHTNVYFAAAECCRAIATKLGGSTGGHKSVGALSIGGGADRAREFKTRAKELEIQGARRTMTAPVVSTALRVSTKDTYLSDTDMTPHTFQRGLHDHDGTDDGFDEVTERGD